MTKKKKKPNKKTKEVKKMGLIDNVFNKKPLDVPIPSSEGNDVERVEVINAITGKAKKEKQEAKGQEQQPEQAKEQQPVKQDIPIFAYYNEAQDVTVKLLAQQNELIQETNNLMAELIKLIRGNVS